MFVFHSACERKHHWGGCYTIVSNIFCMMSLLQRFLVLYTIHWFRLLLIVRVEFLKCLEGCLVLDSLVCCNHAVVMGTDEWVVTGIMFLISWSFTIVSLALASLLYWYVSIKGKGGDWGDGFKSAYFQLALRSLRSLGGWFLSHLLRFFCSVTLVFALLLDLWTFSVENLPLPCFWVCLLYC